MSLEHDASLNSQLFGYRPNRGDSTRIRILGAAITLMAEGGLESITFDVIGEKVGLGKANVRYHFQDKQSIFLAAIKYIVINAQSITREAVAQATTPSEQLKAVIVSGLMWLEDFPAHAKVWLLFWSLSTRNEEYLALHHEARTVGAERLSSILKSLKPAKLTSKQALSLARHIQKLITAEVVEHLTCSYTDKARDRIKNVSQAMKRELLAHGVEWDV